MGSWPANVGIVAIELIFPPQYVDQAELEKHDGVSAGKYTIGLGQSKMGFCSDREDVNSLCLTVVHKLLERQNISFNQIGRLEVGTETLLDKCKSVKSVLMQLFEPHGATDMEGIDTTNACYGGTAALFNAVAWVESSAWDGRFAMVVAGDIAAYPIGSARPTGGAGAVAMLVGPNAPLAFDRHIRSSFMRHVYDFYKPDLGCEYAIFDGKLSIQCYLSALDNCYQLFCKKSLKANPDSPVGLEAMDAMVFHSPYCKLVQKSVARILLNDFLMTPLEKRAVKYPGLEQFNNVKLEDSYFDRDIEKAFMTVSQDIFEKKTKSTLHLANQIGNMYTPSLYGCLVSLLLSQPAESLAGKRLGMFSYGSGLASSMFSITVTKDFAEGSALDKLIRNLSHIKPLLEKRVKVSAEKFTELMDHMEVNAHKAPYEPFGTVENMFPGTYYLHSVDELHRRTYHRVPN